MPSGGCFCDKIRLSYNGEPNAHAICHCLDCRKISGSTYSNNIIVPADNFKLESGKPKEISKIADSGNKITSFFCPDCGTTLYRISEKSPRDIILKAGVLDDPQWPNENVPKAELFTVERVKWIPALDGAAQLEGTRPA